jgi:hypothetical protein
MELAPVRLAQVALGGGRYLCVFLFCVCPPPKFYPFNIDGLLAVVALAWRRS